MNLFSQLFNPSHTPQVDPAQVSAMLAQSPKPYLLDVRTPDEYKQGHISGAELIPLDELPNRLNEIPKDQQILVICHSGNRSKQGRDILVNAGYNAVSMTGGLLAWIDKGYPLDGTPPAQ